MTKKRGQTDEELPADDELETATLRWVAEHLDARAKRYECNEHWSNKQALVLVAEIEALENDKALDVADVVLKVTMKKRALVERRQRTKDYVLLKEAWRLQASQLRARATRLAAARR